LAAQRSEVRGIATRMSVRLSVRLSRESRLMDQDIEMYFTPYESEMFTCS